MRYENNKEAFIDWFGSTVSIEDCDPAIFMTNYFFDRFEYNIEQRLWLCWIYGTTYHWPTAYVIWNEFPDMELVGVDRLKDWNDRNYKRLRYQTDTKWNKGHLPDQFLSYKQWVGGKTQREKFAEYLKDTPVQNFSNLWDVCKSEFYKFGRYSTWFYLQVLKQCCKLPIESETLFLEDHSGSRSHRNGLCYALGKEEWIDKKLNKAEINYLVVGAKELLEETKTRYPEYASKIDYFAMETCLCSFKKLFRKSRGRYLGYYLDRQAEEIIKVENDGWTGINWLPLWQAREETVDKKYLTNFIDKSKMHLFLDRGIIHNEEFSLEAFCG